VHGNVDEPELRRRLPAAIELELGGSALAITHDAGPAQDAWGASAAAFHMPTP